MRATLTTRSQARAERCSRRYARSSSAAASGDSRQNRRSCLDERCAFAYVASRNKASILSKTDEEISSMMQSMTMGGGFITSAVHTDWLAGAEEGDIEKVRGARDLVEMLQPYRSIGSDFDAIYAARKRK